MRFLHGSHVAASLLASVLCGVTILCTTSVSHAKLIIDTRLTGRTGEATPQVGEVFTYALYARIVGENSDRNDDGLKIITGSIVSRDLNGGLVRGDIVARPLAPFDSLGTYGGDRRDVDGDGDIDAGGYYDGTNRIGVGWFAVRSGAVQHAGELDGELKFAEVTFTVTEVLRDVSANADTWVAFEKRQHIQDGALWVTDGRPHSFKTDPSSGPAPIAKGSPLADVGITPDPGGELYLVSSFRGIVPEPTSMLIISLTGFMLSRPRRR